MMVSLCVLHPAEGKDDARHCAFERLAAGIEAQRRSGIGPPILEGKNGGPPITALLAKSAEDGVRQILNVPLIKVLSLTWAKYSAVVEALQKTRSSNSTAIVELLEHEIKVTEHPEIKISWNGRDLRVLRLNLEIVATIHAANLVVSAGAMDSVETGDIAVRITLKYKDLQPVPGGVS